MTQDTLPDVALMFPPIFTNDLRGPYLTLPHLLAFVRSRGMTGVKIHDVNGRFWSRMLAPEFLERVHCETEDALATSTSSERVDLLHRLLVLEYFLEDPARLRSDARALRQFSGLIFDRYYTTIERNVPSQIRAVFHRRAFDELENALDDAVAALPERTRLVALTVPMADQFYSALGIALRAKKRFGTGTHVAMGGSIFTLLDRNQQRDVLDCGLVDSLGMFEGELAVLGLCERVVDGGEASLDGIPNLLLLRNGLAQQARIQESVPLDECPAPEFPDDLLQDYGPSMSLPVWATRGCYWGKCTFCDYVHLSANNNHAETIRVTNCVDVVQTLMARHGATRFEMISECLSPSFSRRFAAEIMERGFDIRWTTHLKVEKQFGPELCAQMHASGCRRVTIGVESFNDRQLEVMKKGCTRADVVAMLHSLTGAGIEAAINIIVNFPTVTTGEAEETLRFLEEYRTAYADVNVFPFVLSKLTDIAAQPEEFEIAISSNAAQQHNRGFHFVEFERVGGMRAEDEERLIRAYQTFGQSHRRRMARERSLELLATGSLETVVVAPAERLLPLRGTRADAVGALLQLERNAAADDLLFDLESKSVRAVPRPIVRLFEQLPAHGVSGAEIAAATDGDDGSGFAADVIRYGVHLNLFTVHDATS